MPQVETRRVLELNAAAPSSQKSSRESLSETAKCRLAISEMVTATAEVMGGELSAPALALFVTDLEKLPVEVIAHALARCRREIRGKNGFPPTLTIADVLDRAGVVSAKEVEDSECRAAWDSLLLYAGKHIISDPEGNYGKRRYFGVTIQIPELDQRTADTLRRVGGWKAVKTMTEDDYPFVQKRFYEEYRAWNATEAALSAGALSGNQSFAKLLESRAMPGPKRIAAPPCAALPEAEEARPAKPKVQAINSKEELRKQAAELAKGDSRTTGEKKTWRP